MKLTIGSITLLSAALTAFGLSPGDLQVSVNAVSPRVSSIEDIILTSIVSNPTDASIRVIRVANVLDNGPTKSFAVTKDGASVDFTGVVISPDFARNPEANFVTIAPRESIAINHTVSDIYDFSSHGTGTFTFIPWSTFQTAPGSPPLVVDVAPVLVEVTADVGFRALAPASSRKASTQPAVGSTLSCDDPAKLNDIEQGLEDSRALSARAAEYLRANPDSAEWNKFFGSGIELEEIAGNYEAMAGDVAPRSGERFIYCNEDPFAICNRSTAYEFNGQIYMCDHWFEYRSIGEVCTVHIDNVVGSHESIILHELTHAMFQTIDHAYGCGAVQGLSAEEKRTNADNYECLALAVYQIFEC